MIYDLVVIGGGPGGYAAAIRASQLGKKVACVELEKVGGTCLNWGCIPTKALLKNAHMYHKLKYDSKKFGLTFENLSYNWSSIIDRSRHVSNKLSGGIEYLFKNNNVDYIKGSGAIEGPGTVRIGQPDETVRFVKAENIIIATGAKPREMNGLAFNQKSIISSKAAMVLEKQPDSMIIIGAGAIGVEFAYIYNTFGTNVTIVETQADLLPAEDSEVSGAITNSYRKEGITCLTNSTVTSANDHGCSVRLTVQGPGGEKELSADCCLVAIGVSPVIPDGEKPDLTERGWIKVDRNFQTSIPRVYAIGDVSGPPWLAHIASYEATQCVDGIFVEGARIRPLVNFPSCTYSYPEVASVGKTEQALKIEGIPYKSSKFPYQALGKAHTESLNEGFIKLLACEETNQLLGAHIIGSNATEIISEMCLAISRAASLEQVKNTIHPLPSFSEGIHEAALGINGQPIHC